MRAQNCDDIRKKMKDAIVCPSSMKPFKTVFVEDANIFKEETISSQASLHSVQLIRNLPNILRNSNTKTPKNCKLLNKIDTSFIFSAEDGNTSLELNTTSSSIDLDMEANYNKTASPKSHHQRKQVHNPLDIQDISDCNNNKNKNIPKVLPKIDQFNALRVSPSREETVPAKRIKYNNKEKKRLVNKKSKKITVRKSDSKLRTLLKKPDTLATIPDVNTMNTIVQNTNNFLENNVGLTQPVCNPNLPNVNVNDLHDIATKSVEPFNILYRNNEVYNVERKYDVNLNHVSWKPTEFNTVQHKTIQRGLTSYEFPITENNLQRESIDMDIDSDFLYKPKILYSCSCANCMSNDKDIMFYEDPVSTSTSSDDTDGSFMWDLYTNIYDFYIDDYSRLFDNLMDFEETNLYYGEFGENNITKENACTGTKSTTELIGSSANMPSMDQNKLQNLQPCNTDRIQDCVGSCPTELVTYPNETIRMENRRVFDDTDTFNLNSENFSMKESEIIPQGEVLMQTAISTDVPVSNSKCQTPENKKDLCVIRCSQCEKLFNKKQQLWKHFTRCNFYKENFECHICSKTYRHKSSLAQHLWKKHTVSHGLHDKFYICNKCSKSYVRFRSFRRHMLLHDD